MSYRVEYDAGGKGGVREVRPRRRLFAWTAVFLLLFALLVNVFWPRGREVLGELVWPGDFAVTAAALEELAGQLRMGVPLGEAVEGFCREVIADAGLGQG